jgi:hypothetical protein
VPAIDLSADSFVPDGNAFKGSAEPIGSEGARRFRDGVEDDDVVLCIAGATGAEIGSSCKGTRLSE